MSNQNFEGFTPYDRAQSPAQSPPPLEEDGVGPWGPWWSIALGFCGGVRVAVGRSLAILAFLSFKEVWCGWIERKRDSPTSWIKVMKDGDLLGIVGFFLGGDWLPYDFDQL